MPGSTVVSPRIPASFWPLALLGFVVPSATIFQTLAVAWQLSQTGAIASVLPTMVALGAATRIASGIPLGHWVKINGANASCFMALWIEVCVLLGMGIVLSGIGSIWLLVPLEMASALAVTGFLISRQTLLKEMLAQSNGREAASGVNRALQYASKLVLPVVGGSLLIFIDAYAALLCCSAVLALSAILLRSSIFQCQSSCRHPAGKEDFIGGIRKTLSFYRGSPEALDAVIVIALFNFVLAPLTVIIPMHVSKLPFATSLSLGLSEASLGAGAVGGAILFARLRTGSPKHASLPVAGASLALLVSAQPEIPFGYQLFNLSLFVLAMSVAYSGSLIDSLLIRLIPSNLYATIVGVQILLVGVSYPLGLCVSSWFLKSERFVGIIAGYNAALALFAFALLQAREITRCAANRHPT
ncbi:MFS transporter [Ralstonia solanacearum]|uniref:MFS transporter n=1 Tax=Ralstonia solanacearum TaxID=305 RepID=UPI001FFC2831|nr:MFS transporter [Ralstonia solanacearum]MDB0527197.1 MFS transporter [Ralstonia solanacearum]